MRCALLMLAAFALSSAATHNGDGKFGLFLNQSIGSHTGYDVILEGIGYQAGTPSNATYLITGGSGEPISEVTLGVNGTYNASFAGSNARISKSILSVSLLGFGQGEDPGGIPGLYAVTKVSSADFQYYAPPLNVTSVTVWPRKYDATVFWTTNDGANGTLLVYDSASALVNATSDSNRSESHSVGVGGLMPGENYSFVIQACDILNTSCVLSDPVSVTMLGGENAAPGPGVGEGDGAGASMNASPDIPDGTVQSQPAPLQTPGLDDLALLAGLAAMAALAYLCIRSTPSG